MHPYIPKSLAMGPVLMRAAFDRLPQSKWDHRLDPKRFTPREAMAHLRYWESVSRERMRLALLGSGTPVANWDEDRHCKEHNYAELDPHQMLTEWENERQLTINWLKSCPPAFLTKFIVHRVAGQMNIEQIACTQIAHDVYHLEHLLEVEKS